MNKIEILNNYNNLIKEFGKYREKTEEKIRDLQSKLDTYKQEEFIAKINKNKEIDSLEYDLEYAKKCRIEAETESKYLKIALEDKNELVNKLFKMLNKNDTSEGCDEDE